MSVVILDADGLPWAWAGRHRLPPAAQGDSIGSRATGYYVVLEARRHTADGRVAVAGVLIWAHPAVPDRGRSLAELFRERTEVGLMVYPPNTAPDSADVFDYEEPTTAGPRLLFSVRPGPAGAGHRQGAGLRAREPAGHLARAARRSRLASAWPDGRSSASRSSAALVWLAGARAGRAGARTPAAVLARHLLPAAARPALGLRRRARARGHPAHDRRRLALAASGSPGAGTASRSAARCCWPRPTSSAASAAASRRRPTACPIGLWLSWQLALMVSAAALIVPTAALFRGSSAEPPGLVAHRRRAWRSRLAASVIGVLVWSPRGGWPDWYTFLWTPALLLVTLPRPALGHHHAASRWWPAARRRW